MEPLNARSRRSPKADNRSTVCQTRDRLHPEIHGTATPECMHERGQQNMKLYFTPIRWTRARFTWATATGSAVGNARWFDGDRSGNRMAGRKTSDMIVKRDAAVERQPSSQLSLIAASTTRADRGMPCARATSSSVSRPPCQELRLTRTPRR